jgi:hypothetical protein
MGLPCLPTNTLEMPNSRDGGSNFKIPMSASSICMIRSLLAVFVALAMIEKKVEGEEIKAVAPAPRRTGQVVDIFEALKKSLESAGQQKSQTAERGKRKRKA